MTTSIDQTPVIPIDEVSERIARIVDAVPETHPYWCKPSAECIGVMDPLHTSFVTSWSPDNDDVEIGLRRCRQDSLDLRAGGRIIGEEELVLTLRNTAVPMVADVHLNPKDLDILLHHLQHQQSKLARYVFEVDRKTVQRLEGEL
jgi:hypothetical protein